MGRINRMICEGDIYHVTTRGVAQQSIFEDNYDRLRLLKLLRDSSEKFCVTIHAWCFMSNHVHLLLQASMEKVSSFMNSVLSRYAKNYNERHGRTGHLFQERFYSSPIDTDEYLLAAVRYIHFNPIGIGIHDLEKYQWSSYREYLGSDGLSDTSFVLSVFGGLQSFKDFHALPNNDQIILASKFEGSQTWEPPTDDDLIVKAKALLGIDNLSIISQADKNSRNNMLVTLKSTMTIRQIARITGLGRNVIQRAK